MKSYVLIIPNKIKKFIIKKVREKYFNYDIKFLSIEEFIKRCTFDYDNQAVYHVMKKYQMKYSSASVYLKNLPYIDDKIINSKMEFLKEIKKDLDDKKLLKYDYLFKESIKNKEIVLYGYDYLTKYQKKILSNYNYREIKITKVSYNLDKIFHAASIDDEVIFVANKISELIKNNVAINNIKVILWNEYEEVVSRIFELYHLPISIKRTSLYSSYTCKKVLNNLGNLEAVLETIEDSPLYEKIINVLNNYSFIENKEEVRELIENDFKKTYITNQIRDGIEVVSLDSYFSDDDYVFLLGYNKENLPKVQKDDDYFNDREKITLNLDTSTEINILEKEKTISNIRSIKNLTITTKDYSSTANYTISDLFDSLQIVEIENNTYVNSVIMNKIFLTEKLDNLVNYNIKDKDLDLLYSNYSSVPYRKYSNKFTGIEKDNLYKKLKNKLLLSYSSLNNYNQCKFKFYIARILEVKSGRDDFSKLIGNVCHYVLSKIDKEDFTISKYFDQYLRDENKLELTNREKFLLDCLKDELAFIIDTIKKQLTYTTFDQKLYEKEVYVNIDKKIKVSFKGIIDKLLYKEEDNTTFIVVIDYKTGNPSLKLKNIKYGLDMQLPIYLYLSSNLNFPNMQIVGFYLQKILSNNINNKKDYDEAREDSLKLEGYSLDNQNILSKFDKTYSDSKLIKGMKVTANGDFYKNSKVLSEEEISNLLKAVTTSIDDSIDNILEADFEINPKVINGENVSCSFCEYRDICYRREEDINYINDEEKEDEENAVSNI